jgi:hypothetical protein
VLQGATRHPWVLPDYQVASAETIMDDKLRIFASATIACALASCASTGIVPADGNTFIVSDRGPTLGFSPPIRQTAKVFKEANEYCARQGKQVEQVKLDQMDSGLARPAAATLQFRCVPKSAGGT